MPDFTRVFKELEADLNRNFYTLCKDTKNQYFDCKGTGFQTKHNNWFKVIFLGKAPTEIVICTQCKGTGQFNPEEWFKNLIKRRTHNEHYLLEVCRAKLVK